MLGTSLTSWAILVLPWLAMAGLLLNLPGFRGSGSAKWLWAVPAALFLAMISLLPAVQSGSQNSLTLLNWLPDQGIRLSFQLDGLALFFGMVVTGMGTLIFIYTAGYFKENPRHFRRFYGYLLLFMAAMVGTVFSGNLLLLYVWWELTGVASFFLIGYLHESEESRRGARMALLTTITTGLCLLAGIVLVGITAGTFEINELIRLAPQFSQDPVWAAGALLMLIGAFGKSAQFPFHYWLPNAMAAPTPVSAYLHSATMVKLGVFLIARVFPIFSSLEIWLPLLSLIGFFTFLLGAVFSFLSNKLKAILAFSTVSQLGFLVGFYGISPPSGTHWDLLHILNHVLYKGALFMVVGIIDHATHIKDIRQLGGLRKRLPLMAIASAISAASMAGVILTSGFLSKEYMLKEKLDYLSDGVFLNAFPLTMVILASVLKVAFSIRFVVHIFFGPESEKATAHFHKPGFLFQLPPLILASLTLLFGFSPSALSWVLQLFATPGLQDFAAPKLKLWHGLDSTAFQISMGILFIGTLLYLAAERLQWRFTVIPPWMRFDEYFDRAVEGLPAFGRRLSRWIGVDSPNWHVAIVLSVGLLWIGVPFLTQISDWSPPEFDYGELIQPIIAAILLVAAALALLLVRSWRGQVIFVGTIGFLVMFYFVIYRAPDLALTQVLVEAASLVLLLVVIIRFPQLQQPRHSLPKLKKSINAVIAVSVGILMGLLTLVFGRSIESEAPLGPLGDAYLDASLPLAKGTNAVNTILVDFRGFDTLMEIGVLTIATLGILGLLVARRKKESRHA